MNLCSDQLPSYSKHWNSMWRSQIFWYHTQSEARGKASWFSQNKSNLMCFDTSDQWDRPFSQPCVHQHQHSLKVMSSTTTRSSVRVKINLIRRRRFHSLIAVKAGWLHATEGLKRNCCPYYSFSSSLWWTSSSSMLLIYVQNRRAIPFWARNLLYISVTGARCDERMQDNQSLHPVAGLESNVTCFH